MVIKAQIDQKECDRSPHCSAKENCPTGAIRQSKNITTYDVDESLCDGCGLCRFACLNQAISMKQV